MDDENAEIATQVAGLGASCTLYRPVGWDGPAFCIEYANTPLTLADGEEYSAGGYSPYGPAWGSYGVTCHDGWLVTDFAYCYYGYEP